MQQQQQQQQHQQQHEQQLLQLLLDPFKSAVRHGLQVRCSELSSVARSISSPASQ
jgi:hypothetical protein